MSEEKKGTLPKSQTYEVVVIFTMMLLVAGLLVIILNEMNAPWMTYALTALLSLAWFSIGAVMERKLAA